MSAQHQDLDNSKVKPLNLALKGVKKDLGKEYKEFHFLDITAQSLQMQIAFIHQKQSILFSLSTALVAIMLYSGQPWWAILPFICGITAALLSIVPLTTLYSVVKFNKTGFSFGTIPEAIDEISDLTMYQYAQLYLMNLQQLDQIVRGKNWLVAITAVCFLIGVFLLLVLAFLGRVTP